MTLASFHIPIKTPNPVNGSHQHWSVASGRRKRQRRAAYLACPVVALPVTVRMVRLSSGVLDDDNLRPALKSIRDGIADRLGVADNDPRIRFEYAQRRVRPTLYGVEVEILEGST